MSKKNIMKIIAVVIACMLMVCAFGACSSTKEEPAASEAPAAAETEAAAEAPAAEEPAAEEAAAEAPAGDSVEGVRVIYVAPAVGHPVWLVAKEGMDAAAAEFGIDAQWTGGAEHTTEEALNAFDAAIAAKPDAIAVCPLDPTTFSSSMDEAKEAGIPVVTICVDAASADQRVCFVGPDNYAIGTQQAEALYAKVGGPLKVGVMMSNLDAANQMIQVDALKAFLETIPDSEIVDMQANNADQTTAATLFQSMITAHPEMNCLFGCEGGGAPAYGQVLKENNMTDKICVITMDDTEQNLATLEEGSIYGLIAQGFYNMGYYGTLHAAQAAKGIEVPEIVAAGSVLVTKDNIDTYKEEW